MVRRFLKYYRPHIGLFLLTITVAMGESFCKLFVPVFVRNVLKDYLPQQNMAMLWWTLGIMLVLIVLTSVFSYIRVKWGHILGVRMEYDMRTDFFSHIQKLSFNYFDNVKTGHIMSRISNDLNTIAEVAHHAPEDILISVSLIIGAFIVMFHFSVELALIALVPIPLLAGWGMLYGGKMKRGFRNVRKKIADINSSVENSVQGIREVKAFANEDEEIDKFEVVNCSFRTAKEDMYGILGVFFSVMNFLIEGYFFVVIAGGAWLIHLGRISVADVLAFVLYIYFILNPIRRLVNFTEQLGQGAACFERFTEVMDIAPDIVDAKDAYEFEPVKGDIVFEGVSFKYQSSDGWVLRDINMHIAAHSTVAIVGESGAGKSTIASLVPRFYEPQEGAIRIDGHDVAGLRQRFLRRNIGIVQQNVFLFDSTIRENIMYGNPRASEEQMIAAAKKANIFDFIMTLAEGFDSLVGERGVELSGGQKQRISIARVFLNDPPVFIFDEATSSLDTESEALVQKSLEMLSEDRTTIIIAHRLSTVRRADRLFVVKEGRVVEEGTHEELLESRKYYHTLYSLNLL